MTFHNTGLKHGVEVAQTQPLDSQIISPEKLQGEKGEHQQLNYRIKTTSSNEPPTLRPGMPLSSALAHVKTESSYLPSPNMTELRVQVALARCGVQAYNLSIWKVKAGGPGAPGKHEVHVTLSHESVYPVCKKQTHIFLI